MPILQMNWTFNSWWCWCFWIFCWNCKIYFICVISVATPALHRCHSHLCLLHFTKPFQVGMFNLWNCMSCVIFCFFFVSFRFCFFALVRCRFSFQVINELPKQFSFVIKWFKNLGRSLRYYQHSWVPLIAAECVQVAIAERHRWRSVCRSGFPSNLCKVSTHYVIKNTTRWRSNLRGDCACSNCYTNILIKHFSTDRHCIYIGQWNKPKWE